MSEIPATEFEKLPKERVYTYSFLCVCGATRVIFKSTKKLQCRCGRVWKVNFASGFVHSIGKDKGWQIKIDKAEKS